MQKHSLFDPGIITTGIITTLPVYVFVRKTICMYVFNILLNNDRIAVQNYIYIYIYIHTHTHKFVYTHIKNFDCGGSYMYIHIY